MIPEATTTCSIVDASTTICTTADPAAATGTPGVLWQYDAGELVISFLLVVLIAFEVFRGLIHVFE